MSDRDWTSCCLTLPYQSYPVDHVTIQRDLILTWQCMLEWIKVTGSRKGNDAGDKRRAGGAMLAIELRLSFSGSCPCPEVNCSQVLLCLEEGGARPLSLRPKPH